MHFVCCRVGGKHAELRCCDAAVTLRVRCCCHPESWRDNCMTGPSLPEGPDAKN